MDMRANADTPVNTVFSLLLVTILFLPFLTFMVVFLGLNRQGFRFLVPMPVAAVGFEKRRKSKERIEDSI
jgi:hypothetical protein